MTTEDDILAQGDEILKDDAILIVEAKEIQHLAFWLIYAADWALIWML